MRVTVKTLRFMPKAWIQMWTLTRDCNVEISARGLLVDGTDDLVQEFFVVDQECSGVITKMDSEAVETLNLQLMTDGHDLQNLCVYWHSHVNMGTSPSPTDEKTFASMANGRFLWSLITNKSGAAAALAGKGVAEKDLYVRLDLFDPDNHAKDTVRRMTLHEVGYAVYYGSLVPKVWAKESLEKVRPEPAKVYAPPANQHPNKPWTPKAPLAGKGATKITDNNGNQVEIKHYGQREIRHGQNDNHRLGDWRDHEDAWPGIHRGYQMEQRRAALQDQIDPYDHEELSITNAMLEKLTLEELQEMADKYDLGGDGGE